MLFSLTPYIQGGMINISQAMDVRQKYGLQMGSISPDFPLYTHHSDKTSQNLTLLGETGQRPSHEECV
jgi:hypothetical protein